MSSTEISYDVFAIMEKKLSPSRQCLSEEWIFIEGGRNKKRIFPTALLKLPTMEKL